MNRTQVFFPKEMHAGLKILARREKVSMGEIIRDLVSPSLKKRLASPSKSMKNGLLELAKLGRRGVGPKDVSEKFDEYLYGR